MKFKKITKEDAENLNVGDFVFKYPTKAEVKDEFDESDLDNISKHIIESIRFDNIELGFIFPKEGVSIGTYNVKIGSIHKKRSELYKQDRYWILAE